MFPIHANSGIAPPRFRTKEDAELFMECLKLRNPFPQEKWVHPYELKGKMCTVSDDYKNAPFELKYFYGSPETVVDCDSTISS